MARTPRWHCHDPTEVFRQGRRLRSPGAPPGNAGSSSNSAFLLPPFVCCCFSLVSKALCFHPLLLPQFRQPRGHWWHHLDKVHLQWGIPRCLDMKGPWPRCARRAAAPPSAMNSSGCSRVTGLGRAVCQGTELCGAGRTPPRAAWSSVGPCTHGDASGKGSPAGEARGKRGGEMVPSGAVGKRW